MSSQDSGPNRAVGGCGDRRPPAFYGGIFMVQFSFPWIRNDKDYSMAFVLSASPIRSLRTLGPETSTSSLTAARTAV